MDKGSVGTIMELFSSVNSMVGGRKKGKSISCNQMARTHSTQSNTMKMEMDLDLKTERLRRKKSAKDTR